MEAPGAQSEVAHGQLIVKGTRIRAEAPPDMLVNAEPPDPTTPEQVAADMNLPVEAVRGAVAYCEADPPDVREDHAGEEARLKAAGVTDAEGNYIRPPIRQSWR